MSAHAGFVSAFNQRRDKSFSRRVCEVVIHQRIPVDVDLRSEFPVTLSAHEEVNVRGTVAVSTQFNAETAAVLRDAALKAQMQEIGQVLEPSTPEQLGNFLRSETQRLSVVVRNANASVD